MFDLLALALTLFGSWISSSSDSDLNTLIITSSIEKSPGPVNAIEVAEAKYSSKSSNKKILNPDVTRAW